MIKKKEISLTGRAEYDFSGWYLVKCSSHLFLNTCIQCIQVYFIYFSLTVNIWFHLVL
jgi:hypothetical protein